MSKENHDDEPAIRRFLQAALAGGEFSLHQAENGRSARAAAVAVKPDVILLDLGLPDMDGVEVIERLRQWSPVPIIVLSVRERANSPTSSGSISVTSTDRREALLRRGRLRHVR